MAFTNAPVVLGGGGGEMTITESTPLSFRISSRLPLKCSGPAPASISTGFCRLAAAGRSFCKPDRVSGLRSASFIPCISRASAAVTPGPPELVSTATRFPFGKGHQARARAHWNISSVVLARSTPAFANAASKAASCPARAPVWLAAARLPLSNRPTFSATMGFFRATREAVSMNFRPSFTPSR